MAELTPKERLQPSLLDRLTDDEPDQRQESRDKRILSPSRLRESVRRDLTWLFNTPNLETVTDLERFPQVARSVVNFGLPSLAGHATSGLDLGNLERLLRQAIWSFEPRLLRNSIKVRLEADLKQMSHNALSFYIEAELWAQPMPLRLFLKTDIDLEAGSAQVVETSRPAKVA
jgi:type VI secretion system protein ImpF